MIDEPRDMIDGSQPTSELIAEATETAGNHFQRIGYAGWIAKGAVYGLVGVLFLRIAVGASQSDEANQTGAVEAIAEKPAGAVLLAAIGMGLGLYVLWRLFTVVLPGDWTGRAALDRLGYLFSVVVYSSLLATIVGLLGNRNTAADEREDRMVEDLVKDLLSVSAGRIAVIIAGLIVVGIGIVFVRKGWNREFRSEISGDEGVEGRLIDRLGTAGWIARGISVGIIGFFLIRAAWMFDPDQAAGLDDSMRQLAGNPFGAVLSGVVGAGFIAYGAFAGLSARHRDLAGPRNVHD